MNLNAHVIENNPNRNFSIPFIFVPNKVFNVGLSKSVKSKLENRDLTNEVALPILQQIKFESDLLSIFTKPVIILPMCLLGGGTLLVASTMTFAAATIIVYALPLLGYFFFAASLIGYVAALELLFCSRHYALFLNIHEAYEQQSKCANFYICRLKTSGYDPITLSAT